MLNKKSFAGISVPKINKSLNPFEEIYSNDDELILQTKKVYEYKADEGLNFKYRYVLMFTDYANRMSSIDPKYPYYAELLYVLEPEYIDKEIIEDITRYAYGGDDEHEVDIMDLVTEGYYTTIGATRGLYQVIDANQGKFVDSPIDEGFKKKDIPVVITLVSNIIDTVDSFSGEYLDKPVNRMGDTGWDKIMGMMRT
jgi:hypothetical protein